MIELIDFNKSYKSKNNTFSVSHINLKAEKGKITGILGPNGSGKSTILKAICGFHYADSGKILVNSQDSSLELSCNSIPENLMTKIGYVPEISTLPNEMTVQAFIKYVASIHQIEDSNTIFSVIKQCSLEKVLSKKIKTLSKGFQQRVSLAQCLLYNPENLILDEIISGLDPKQIVQIRNLIKELSKDKTILMSTHILQEAESLCDYIYILNNGKIAAEGTEKQIIDFAGTKTFEEAFIKLTSEENQDEC